LVNFYALKLSLTL